MLEKELSYEIKDVIQVKKIGGYVYTSHYEGERVAILPFAFETTPEGPTPKFLTCTEWIPAWAIEHLTEETKPMVMTSISKRLREGTPSQNALELIQRTLYGPVTKEELVELGGIYISRNSSDMCYLYTVDLTGKEQKLGSLTMNKEYAWVDEDKMASLASDPLLLAMFSKLIMRWK